MIRRFEYQNPNGETVDLADVEAGYVPQRISGAEIPLPDNQSVSTPNRDGQTYIRTLLEPRYVNLDVHLLSRGEDLRLQKREMFRALNPKPGLGRIVYRPDGTDPYDEPEYEIDAIYETSAGWGTDRLGETVTVSFRCPDPAWRIVPAETDSASFSPGGWVLEVGGWDIDAPGWELNAAGAELPIDNDGDLETFPVFVVTASEDATVGPAFVNRTTGDLFSLRRGAGVTMDTGDVLTVDMGRKTATLNGANVFGFLTDDSVMWALQPGANDVAVTLEQGSAGVVMTWSRRLVGV